MSAPGPHDQNQIDPLELRRAFGTFLTGVTVITTRDHNGIPRGMTANSFTSVSLDPPLLLVCIGKSASSFSAFSDSLSFAVNLLHESQKDVSSLFASKSTEKFRSLSHDTVHTGAPVLTDCLAWFDCRVHQRVDAGDHIILIGRVQAFGTSPAPPLAFCRGRYAEVKDPLPPGWSPSRSMIVGYLIEADGHILLRSNGRGEWSLPRAGRRRADNLVDLDDSGSVALRPDETFLYSVFDVADTDPGYIIYRGRLAKDPGVRQRLPFSLRFFAIDELPFAQIPEREIGAMLRRYLRERDQERFGIYVDSVDGGRVAMISDHPKPWALDA